MTSPVQPLSIGLPVFNGERFLAEAIESILQQTFGDFTLVTSDSASTDGTEEIGREFARRDPRITFVRHPYNRGAAWNFNSLVRTAERPFFKCAAHDDLLPTAVERCMEHLRERPGAVLSFSRRVKIDESGDVVSHPRGTAVAVHGLRCSAARAVRRLASSRSHLLLKRQVQEPIGRGRRGRCAFPGRTAPSPGSHPDRRLQ